MSTLHSLSELVPEIYHEHCEPLRFGIPHAQKGSVLLAPAQVLEHKDAILDAMQAIYQGDDERALLSQWSKYYIDVVLSPAVVSALVLGRPLAMALEACTLELRGGMPQTLWLPASALGAKTDEPAIRYRSVLLDHLAPMFELLGAAARISPKVLWNNAGNSLEYILCTEFDSAGARRDAAYLLENRKFFDTDRPNPLRQVIRYIDSGRPQLESPFRSRKVCCLRDRLPEEIGLCYSCPLLLTISDMALNARQRLILENSEE